MFRLVFRSGKVVAGFRLALFLDGFGERLRRQIAAAGWRLPQQGPELGEGVPDLEVRAAEVVDDDDIVGARCRHENPLDLSPEDGAVDRPVDPHWRLELAKAQAGDAGRDPRVTVRHAHPQSFAAARVSSEPGRLGVQPDFVEEDQIPGSGPGCVSNHA